MSVSSDPGCAGKKPHKRMGGMAEAVAIASDLGFLINQEQSSIRCSMCYISYCEYLPEGQQNSSNSICGDKGDDLIRVITHKTTYCCTEKSNQFASGTTGKEDFFL